MSLTAMHELTLLPTEVLQLDRDEDDPFWLSNDACSLISSSSLKSSISTLLLDLVVLNIFEIFEDRIFSFLHSYSRLTFVH